VIGWLAHKVTKGLAEFRLLFSLLEAQGDEHTVESCEDVGSSDSVTSLRRTYDFHSLGANEIGRGPSSGSSFDLIVSDGEIAHAVVTMEIEEFGPQMWDPFADWVATNHPEDVAVMYEDQTQTLERVTEASIRLWEQHVRDYVQHVLETQGPS
jgi:hypothetical protein